MSKVVRVSRDGGKSIVRVGDAYVLVDHATHGTESSDSLKTLIASGGWRRPTSEETTSPAVEIAVASQTTLNVNEHAADRQRLYRVPNAVKDAALDALGMTRSSNFFDLELVQLAARISASPSVDIDTITRVNETLLASEKNSIPWSLAGGEAGARWSSRILSKHSTITAGAFTYDANTAYLGGGDDPASTSVNRLYKVEYNSDEYYVRDGSAWIPTDAPSDGLLIELDQESASTLATWLDENPDHAPDEYLVLRNLNPVEHNIFELAADEIDYEFLDRVAIAAAGVWSDHRSPEQRSESASRQGRSSGGQFAPGGGPDAKGEKLNVFARGRLSESLPLLENLNGRINEYLAEVEQQRAGAAPTDETPDEPVVAASPAPETVTVEEATPETSDVAPLYVAIVDEADSSAVLDLVAVVPAKAGTNQGPTAWRRADGQWQFAPDVMADLQSVSPPPVVELKDDSVVKQVLAQIDSSDADQPAEADGGTSMAASGMWGPHGEIVPLYAAGVPGVADTPGDISAAERLRRYWTHGEGGTVKIGWGTGGDWYRCVSHLSKYMGSRAKGYCTLRHHDATGFWPGQQEAKARKAVRASAEQLAPIQFEQSVFTMSALAASLIVTEDDFMPMDLVEAMEMEGDKLDAFATGGAFVIPVLIPEGIETGDKREFEDQSLTTRDLPLPLLWQIKTGSGHDGAVVVGRIDSIERLPDTPGLGRAVGVMDTGPYAREAERLIRGGFLTGVSADLDKFEANTVEEEPELSEDGEELPSNDIKNDKIKVTRARVMAATLVPKPAFQECKIIMVDDPNLGVDEDHLSTVEDGVYEESAGDVEEAEVVLAALAASAAPVQPPRNWFNNPELSGPTPLTITDDGKVFGHIAAWHVDHIGLPRATKPPKSSSNYAYFRTGLLRTEEGEDVAVGQLTLAGGHAPLSAGAEAAVRHYDDTASAVADVAAGEDKYGIWVAGALRPGVTPEQVRVLRASAPSGDWRPINGRLELVAVCQVNVPGFPVARAFVASGQVTALVAAGANYMAQLREAPMASLEARVATIESEALREKREAALARMEPQMRARREALTAAAEAARARMAPLAEARAKKEADEKAALTAAADAARARIMSANQIRESMGFEPRADEDNDSNF